MKFFLSFLFLLFAVFFTWTPAIGSKCIGDQHVSLLNFKKSLVVDASRSTKLVTWDSSTDCCSWYGITCSGDGRVIGLDISSESISGGIDNSSSLFRLQHLQSLNLAQMGLGIVGSRQIPSAIGQLQNLRYLNLSHNSYSGHIPIEISYLARLVILDISLGFNLEIPDLHMLVHNFTDLTELHLHGVPISTPGNNWGQVISSSLPNLRVLSLYYCGLSGPIHESLAKLQSLSVVKLNSNNISAPVPEFFTNFSSLTFLDLRSCSLKGIFPKAIFQLPSLRSIDLSENPELCGSFPEFPENGSLQSLSLRRSNFSGSLPNSLGNFAMLSIVDISWCNFTGPLPKAMANLTHLVYLDMSENYFEGSIPCFERAKNLQVIDLSFNGLTGDIKCSNWGNLSNLKTLMLDDNMLSGNIPSSLFSLTSLYELSLSGNQFSGQFPKVSNDLSNSLEYLDLSSNNVEGPIPVSIFNFRGLRSLDLSSNNFNGSFPLDGFQHQRYLYTLDLSYNNIFLSYSARNFSYPSFPKFIHLRLASGILQTFPDFLRNQSRLHKLDLSDNQISGEVPNWIWELKSLEWLNLSCNSLDTLKTSSVSNLTQLYVFDLNSNKFKGQFPTVSQVSYLDYSRNGFNSKIPHTFGDNLQQAIFISLSSNKLHGVIPGSICKSRMLKVLDLSDNSLSDTIPECLTAMTTLAVLNLRRNNLTKIGMLSKNCSLETLDISENRIQGHFLESLVNCRKLEVLNLGNNQITHPFPCFLKNTSTLRVLILRSNEFYGHIGCPDTSGTWPVLQIIDLANNNFNGEVPAKDLIAWHAMMGKQDDDTSKLNYLQFQGDGISIVRYQDTITVINKGLKIQLVKILKVFTSIDFSGNQFNGAIPKEFGSFTSLYALNLSSNAFVGEIPSSFSNLSQLESLDLSNNYLSGQIPPQLVGLTFLAILDVSYNKLVGRIPSGNQFSTFPRDSFEGNRDLFGPPLTEDDNRSTFPEGRSKKNHPNPRDQVDWDVISVEVGFISGFGIMIGSPLCCKRWRKWYHRAMYNILVKLFPHQEGKLSA